MTIPQALSSIAVIAAVTLLTRAAPFIIFSSGNKPVPGYIKYLGKVLPYATIGMLVVYCIKSVSPFSAPFGLPEAMAISLVIALHKWRHNMFLSIGSGTIFYMLLVQLVFKS